MFFLQKSFFDIIYCFFIDSCFIEIYFEVTNAQKNNPETKSAMTL